MVIKLRASLGLALLVSALVVTLPGSSAVAARGSTKYEICHRTNAVNNPYRRIRVAWGALNGHLGHTGTVFDIANPLHAEKVDKWGDVFHATRGSGHGNTRQINWTTEGRAVFDGSTFVHDGQPRVACRSLTTVEFVASEHEAGTPLREIMADLDEQQASEDLALRSALGSSFTAWYDDDPTRTFEDVVAGLEAKTPSATTGETTSLAPTSVSVHGTVSTHGAAATLLFEYSTSADLAPVAPGTSTPTVTATPATTSSPEPVAIAATLTDLSPETTYFYRVVASVSSGDGDAASDQDVAGTIRSFTTAATDSPSPSPTVDPSPSPTVDPSPSPTVDPSPSPTADPPPSPSPTVTPTPPPTVSPSPPPTPTPPPTVSPSPTQPKPPAPTPSPSPSEARPGPVPTPRPSPSTTPTVTPSPTATATSTPTVAPAPAQPRPVDPSTTAPSGPSTTARPPTVESETRPSPVPTRQAPDPSPSRPSPAATVTEPATPSGTAEPPVTTSDSLDLGTGRPARAGADRSDAAQLSLRGLGRETLGGYVPGSGAYVEVIGARTASQFILSSVGTIDVPALVAAVRESSARSATEFAWIEGVSAARSDDVTAVATDAKSTAARARIFEASQLAAPMTLRDLDVDRDASWMQVTAGVEGYEPGTMVYLAVTSDPLVVAEARVNRHGAATVDGAFPLEALGAGGHRLRLVGTRSLGGVTVDQDGQIQLSADTLREIGRFDRGTHATVTVGGVNVDGGRHTAVRIVPLVATAPWWTLWIVGVAGFGMVGLRRYRHVEGTRRLVVATAILAASCAPALVLGWFAIAWAVMGWGAAIGLVAIAFLWTVPRCRLAPSETVLANPGLGAG